MLRRRPTQPPLCDQLMQLWVRTNPPFESVLKPVQAPSVISKRAYAERVQREPTPISLSSSSYSDWEDVLSVDQILEEMEGRRKRALSLLTPDTAPTELKSMQPISDQPNKSENGEVMKLAGKKVKYSHSSLPTGSPITKSVPQQLIQSSTKPKPLMETLVGPPSTLPFVSEVIIFILFPLA